MQTVTRRQQRELRPTADQFRALMRIPGFAGATVHETLGPHYRHIFWHPNTNAPFTVRGDITLVEVLARLAPSPRQ